MNFLSLVLTDYNQAFKIGNIVVSTFPTNLFFLFRSNKNLKIHFVFIRWVIEVMLLLKLKGRFRFY